ncbi:hypothetical protein SD70_24710 [Gordoniibacillus kamchatkensis]|uniref:Acyltransferase 3 domain-containing protein n=1 Tax=Gordoniibacillus kamchatkensis TaxID=1590651 RepID=A0ABR5ACG9_9BACL|nr:acyltransferase [Paenibacillus sp. VKM B-2647]KIL38731.1 hypothetical protein SD70_24710 [Paenibacillus sp. VKM B-2647]
MSDKQKLLLQASRGVAACFVLLFHMASMSYKYFHYNLFGLNGLARSGGVDYFFVLTGFLIYSIYGKRIGTRQKVGKYLTNRFIRIYPLYWLVTLLVLPVYFLVPSFGLGFETQKDAIIKSLLLIPQSHGPILGVAWSLSYFVLFYGIFALLMRMDRKPAYLLLSIWGALTLCNVLHVPVIGPDISRHFYLNFLFGETNLELAVGCVIAHWAMSHRMNNGAWWLGVGMLGFPAIWLSTKYNWMPYHDFLLYAVPSSMVLIGLLSVHVSSMVPRWLAGLCRLGDASYTILLTHLLSISVLLKLSKVLAIQKHMSFLSIDLTIIILTLLICVLIYRTVERPLVSGLRKLLLPNPHVVRKTQNI